MKKKPAAKKKSAAKKTAKRSTTKKKSIANKPAAKRPASRPAAKRAAAKKKAPKKVEAVPARYGTATPHIIVSPCRDALDFYARAFGAKVLPTMDGPGGVVMHAEMKIGDSMIMLSDEMPMPSGTTTRRTPKNVGATTGGIMLYVKNVDSAFDRAVSAGARSVMPPEDQFWGDRYGQVEDPFGHVWALATHVRDVSMKEMTAAMAAMGPPAA